MAGWKMCASWSAGCENDLLRLMAHVRDVAEQSFPGLADPALRGADFSTVEAANEQVRQQDREVEKTHE